MSKPIFFDDVGSSSLERKIRFAKFIDQKILNKKFRFSKFINRKILERKKNELLHKYGVSS